MGKFYGMWAGSNSALTDAISPDFQAGIEKGMTGLMSALCGAVSIGCQGIAGADQGFCFEQLALDDEWLGYMNYMMEGFEVNEETLALDVIREVGIGGNYLAEEHTVEFMAESRHRDKLFKREFFSADGHKNTSNDILLRARDFVEKSTQGYKDARPVIDDELVKELDKIYEHAKAKLG
jgi:trimethylamine--corrinoid protein Co-methyltransferase